MAYDLGELMRQNRQSFLTARNRGGLFDRVLSLHPAAGLTNGMTAGRMRLRRANSKHLVVDGFLQGPAMDGLRKIANLAWSQVRMTAIAIRLARRPEVKLIFASDVFYLGLLGLIAAKVSGKPLSVAAYQNQDELYAQSGRLAFPKLLPWRWLERSVQRVVLSRAELVESPTANMRDYLLRNGAQPSRIKTLPVARFIDPVHLSSPDGRTAACDLLRALELDANAPRMVMISRLIGLKMVEDGVEAMIAICRDCPNTIGIVLGEGELAERLQRRIDAAGLSRRIVLAGKVTQEALAHLCVGALIISPLTGMALVEASLAGGVPIAYDRDWQPEFVRDGINGYIVPFRDVKAMAERGRELVADPHLFAAMSKKSREAGLAFADQEASRRREIEAFLPFVGALVGRGAER